MPTDDPAKNRTVGDDVPQVLARLLLQARKSSGKRFDAGFWDGLAKDRPNLRDFMYATSYRIAPDNPVLRGEIAAGLGDVVMLLDRAAINAELEARWALPPIEKPKPDPNVARDGASDPRPAV